jgi:hypothetical protein
MKPNAQNRCQWVMPTGQCPKEAVENSNFCKDHHMGEDNSLRYYQITNHMVADSKLRHNAVEEIKDLREEIALCRALIETRLNMARDENELIASMGILSQYICTVEKLVTACHRMDTNLGNILTKTSLLNLAQEVVVIISEEMADLPDREILIDKISTRIISVIGSQNNE